MSQDLETERAALLTIENSGERMVPELSGGPTFWAHVYRYAFACRFAKGKRILDIACGEGYGTSALDKAGAAQVIGIDISEQACRHARDRYGLDARVGSAEQIPLANGSVDVVVSFETIEHVSNPLRFLEECARVLVLGGRLIMSTPNKNVYSPPGQPKNPHHCSEMTEEEFLAALQNRFGGIKLYSQHPRWAPWWSLRTLAADESPWDQNSLFRRLRQSARFRLAPISVNEPTPEQRSSAVEQILNLRPTSYCTPIPCVLRPRREWTGEQPYFFVATAISRHQSPVQGS